MGYNVLLHEDLAMAWAGDSLMLELWSEFSCRDFTPATTPTTAAMSRIEVKRARNSLFLLDFSPENLFPAKNSFRRDIFVNMGI